MNVNGSAVIKKNDTVIVTIEDMSENGEGIGKSEGYTLFVKDTVIGDRAEVKIIKAKKTYGYGRIQRLLEPFLGQKSRFRRYWKNQRFFKALCVQESDLVLDNVIQRFVFGNEVVYLIQYKDDFLMIDRFRDILQICAIIRSAKLGHI